MTGKEKETRLELDRLIDSLVEDVLELSDEEVLKEANEDGLDIDETVSRMQSLVDNAITIAGKQNMATAKASLKASIEVQNHNILSFPLERKISLLRKLTDERPVTMAARNLTETKEADINLQLLAFVNLGLIDDEGNIK